MSETDSDIANYAYLWYKRDTEQLLEFTEEELDKIYEIMLNYSYPCYLTGSELISRMSPEEKIKLLQHESSFIKEKMAEAGLAHIIMMQIPRVLYDLFNLYLTNRDGNVYRFDYDCDPAISKMVDYNALTRKYTDSVKKNIFELNAFIVNYVQEQYSMANIRSFYHEISQEILSRSWNIPALLRRYFGFLPVEEETAKQERKNTISQTIDFEKQYSQGYAILYRGAKISRDSLMVSLSFNASILSGCVNDRTACTLSYMSSSFTGLISSSDNDKIICNIHKFLVHDSSNEDSMFFIPPIHPFVQLHCRGELYHPRTKLGSDFKQRGLKINGLLCLFAFVEQCDYLISDKSFETLDKLYQRYKITTKLTTVIDTFDRLPHRMNFPQVLEGVPAASSAMARKAVVESGNRHFLNSGNAAHSVIGANVISTKGGGRRTRRRNNKKHRDKKKRMSRRH